MLLALNLQFKWRANPEGTEAAAAQVGQSMLPRGGEARFWPAKQRVLVVALVVAPGWWARPNGCLWLAACLTSHRNHRTRAPLSLGQRQRQSSPRMDLHSSVAAATTTTVVAVQLPGSQAHENCA